MDHSSIDELTDSFYRAFRSNGDASAVDALYGIFIKDARIIKNVGLAMEIYDVEGFIEPRRALLSNGSLVDFEEHEVEQRTEVFGNIAQRFSRYAKSWKSNGEPFNGGGAKSMQFVRTAQGWKLAFLIWDDQA